MDETNALYMGGGLASAVVLGGLSYIWNKWRNSNCSANVGGIQVDFKLSKEIKEQINKELEEIPEEHRKKFEKVVDTLMTHKKILSSSPIIKPINSTAEIPPIPSRSAEENV